MLGFAAHIDKRQDRDCRLVGDDRAPRADLAILGGRHTRITLVGDDAEHLDRARNVFYGLLPARLDFYWNLVAHLIRGRAGNIDAARFGQCLDAGGDVHAVAIDVIAVDDDITDIDADPELDGVVFGAARIEFAKLFLDLDRTGDGVDRACEFDQRSVTHELDRPARMGRGCVKTQAFNLRVENSS